MKIYIYVNSAARVCWGRRNKYTGAEPQARYSQLLIEIPAEWGPSIKGPAEFHSMCKAKGVWTDYEWLGINSWAD